jgi:hypothetical protein
MGEAARDYGRQDPGLDSALLRRLLVRPVPRTAEPLADLPVEDEADESLDEALSRLEAENLIIKAALKSERAEAAELRARLAERETAEEHDAVRADRDRWANLVERLLFSGR